MRLHHGLWLADLCSQSFAYVAEQVQNGIHPVLKNAAFQMEVENSCTKGILFSHGTTEGAH